MPLFFGKKLGANFGKRTGCVFFFQLCLAIFKRRAILVSGRVDVG